MIDGLGRWWISDLTLPLVGYELERYPQAGPYPRGIMGNSYPLKFFLKEFLNLFAYALKQLVSYFTSLATYYVFFVESTPTCIIWVVLICYEFFLWIPPWNKVLVTRLPTGLLCFNQKLSALGRIDSMLLDLKKSKHATTDTCDPLAYVNVPIWYIEIPLLQLR